MAELIHESTLAEWEAHPVRMSATATKRLIAAYRESQAENERLHGSDVIYEDDPDVPFCPAHSDDWMLRAVATNRRNAGMEPQPCTCTGTLSPGHDPRCEREYTRDGHVFIDCLCHIRLVQAEAWDTGYSAGVCAPANRALGLGEPANPYRPTPPAGGDA